MISILILNMDIFLTGLIFIILKIVVSMGMFTFDILIQAELFHSYIINIRL